MARERCLNQIVLIGTLVVLSWFGAAVGLCDPGTNQLPVGSTRSTNDTIVVVPLVKSHLAMNGLYASASVNKAPIVATASATVNGLRWLQDSQNEDGSCAPVNCVN